MNQLAFLFLLIFTLQSCRTPDSNRPVIVVPPQVDRDTTGQVLKISNTANFKYWRHHPMHPANGEAVTFEVMSEEKIGITKVELLLFEYELFRNHEGLPSKRRRSTGQWGLVKTWEIPATLQTEKLSYTYTKGFPAKTHVVYLFRVYNQNGEISERMAGFDAGDSPWPQDKILLYGATEESLQHTINICFFPDTDYNGDWQQFLEDLDTLIYQGYHLNNVISSNKNRWRFYYTQTETDGYALSQDYGNPDRFPPFMKDSLIFGIDAFGLLHRQPYSDGAYMLGNIRFLSHNVFTSESYNLGTAVHETAHTVFNLSDEYEGCACFEAPEGGSNMFTSLAGCQEFNQLNNFDDPSCSTIVSYSGQQWYMPEQAVMFQTEAECLAYNEQNGYSPDSCFVFIDLDGSRFYRAEQGVCIMQDDGDRQVRKFQRTCRSIIQSYYDRLPPMQDPQRSIRLQDQKENMFDYEAVVLMELTLQQNNLEIKTVDKVYGVPEKNLVNYRDFQVELIDEKGKVNYSFEMDRPDCLHFEGGAKDSFALMKFGKIRMAVPDCEGMDKIVCRSEKAILQTEKKVFKVGSHIKKIKLK